MDNPPPLAPQLKARFAKAARLDDYSAVLKQPPAPGVNLALLLVVTLGVTAAIWIAVFVVDDFADDRGKGVSIAGIVTAAMAFAAWWGIRDRRARTAGVPRTALVMVGAKTEDGVQEESGTRFRVCRVTLMSQTGAAEQHQIEPHIYDEVRVGDIGVVAFRGKAIVEFRELLAAPERSA